MTHDSYGTMTKRDRKLIWVRDRSPNYFPAAALLMVFKWGWAINDERSGGVG